MRKTVNTATLLVVLLGSSLAIAQTKTAKPSTVGVWKLDVTQSKFGSEGAPEISHFNHPQRHAG